MKLNHSVCQVIDSMSATSEKDDDQVVRIHEPPPAEGQRVEVTFKGRQRKGIIFSASLDKAGAGSVEVTLIEDDPDSVFRSSLIMPWPAPPDMNFRHLSPGEDDDD